jgi:hypothetical protein
MTDAQLGQEGIDRPDLHAAASAAISQLGRTNVILAIRHQQRDGRKAIQYPIASLGAGEALKKLLQDQTCRKDGLAAFDGLDKGMYFRRRRGRIAPKSKRPHAGVHEKAQPRIRSAL